ncbi:LysR family transcriptional regulator [Janthinobacterium sp. NFX145]|uniref:LysR family transcriptional regulator n=1 Tax=Janthinobacterium sp. NFX145 TaxID=3415602 RepID=UPI003CC5AD29
MTNMNMRLSVDALRVFRTVAQTGNMSQAATLLHLSQSAVSWKIKRLEQQLGCLLLLRGGKTLDLTDQGALLLQHAARIVDAHDEAVACFSPSAMRGQLRIGVAEQVSLPEVCRVIALFAHQHPQVEVQLVIAQSQLLRQLCAGGELDIILHQDFAGLAAPADRLLWLEKLHWCAPLAGQHLSGQQVKLISYGPDCFYRRLAEEKLNAAGMAWSVALECPSIAGMLTAIAAGLGVGILNEYSLNNSVRRCPELEHIAPLPQVASLLRVADKQADAARDAFCALLVTALHQPA